MMELLGAMITLMGCLMLFPISVFIGVAKRSPFAALLIIAAFCCLVVLFPLALLEAHVWRPIKRLIEFYLDRLIKKVIKGSIDKMFSYDGIFFFVIQELFLDVIAILISLALIFIPATLTIAYIFIVGFSVPAVTWYPSRRSKEKCVACDRH